MLLSELEWETPQDPEHDKRSAIIGGYTVYECLSGLFDIWSKDFEDGARNADRWDDLTAIEAQAILFHLTSGGSHAAE